MIVPVIALVGAIITAVLAYWLNQRAARHERRAKAFAEALAAVETYAEMPYLIRRRKPTPEARHELTAEISKIQSQLAFHEAWMRIEAPNVAISYANLIQAAKTQAGQQMSDAWRQPVLTSDEQMNLGVGYSRDQIDAARTACVTAMLKALGHRRRAQLAQTTPATRSGGNTC
ncbi:MAG: hypothetical protein GEV03_19085 [Streptosporangiales bacterium]|nr:hypothetical protein [Streptosporangiales bacterium]